MSQNGRRLVLFDIDGTLLSAGRASRDALVNALRTVHPHPLDLDRYEFSGKTDPQIIRELLEGRLDGGLTPQLLSCALDLYLENLEREIRPENVKLKPGVEALLARLSTEPVVTLGLLTGNLERGARIKLEPVGFNRYFPFGAFGSDHHDRYCLPAIAVARARQATGIDFHGKSIVVVGDSIHDVGCGRSLGVKTIAVSTGLTTAAALARERPDHLFESFTQTGSVAEAILA
jgi:phosphoglycolate phosphatase-like HAD superfamily hydrolase